LLYSAHVQGIIYNIYKGTAYMNKRQHIDNKTMVDNI